MDSSNTIKKNYKLMGTESDPLIIAQRLLNLYRQLHIFSPEKKEAYNQMLMEQSPEVKRTLGALPGGIVVQQYLADIEEQAGVAVESYDNDGAPVVDNNSTDSDTAPKVVMKPASVTVASDPEMIKEIVSAFKEAIVTSEKNRKEDTKELAQTIIALQSKLTQTMLGKQPVGGDGSSFGNATHLEEIVAGITQAQSQLIKDMAQAQTQELSELISRVLKEIQQMSTQTLVDAVQTVHRESMDFFKNQIFSSVSMVPMAAKIAEPKAQYEYERNKAEKVHIDDLADVQPVSLDEDFDDDTTLEQPQPAAAPQPAPAQEPVAVTEPASVPETETEKPYDLSAYDDSAASDDDGYEWEYVEEEEPTDNAQSAAEQQASDDDYEWEYVEDDGSEPQDGYEYVESDPEAPADETASDDDYEWEYVEEEDPAESENQTATSSENAISLDEYDDKPLVAPAHPDLSLEPAAPTKPQAAAESETQAPLVDSFDTDPYNPNLKNAAPMVDNPLFGHGDNLVFKDNTPAPEAISLGDDFGLSSSDDSMSLPR